MRAERAVWREQQGPVLQVVVYPAHSASPGVTHRTLGPQTWFTGNGPRTSEDGKHCVWIHTHTHIYTGYTYIYARISHHIFIHSSVMDI